MERGIGAYDVKSSFEKQILAQFNCDVVQRNKGLDGVMRWKINNKGLGIKIQKVSESIEEAAQLLELAMSKKDFEYSLLIKTSPKAADIRNQNIIVLPLARQIQGEN